MYPRICLFGLPRCGSQYIAELIKENSNYVLTDLIEPYTGNSKESNMPLPVLNPDNSIRMEFLDGYIGEQNVLKRIDYINNIITQNNQLTPLILRLFPYHYLWNYMPLIVKNLRKNGFTFFIIKRTNLEHHILSYLIAQATNEWRLIKEKVPQSVTINESLFESIDYIIKNSLNFINYAAKINIDGHVVTYENAKEDLEKIYNKPFNNQTAIKKQGLSNPYDQIINASEVKHRIITSINQYVTS